VSNPERVSCVDVASRVERCWGCNRSTKYRKVWSDSVSGEDGEEIGQMDQFCRVEVIPSDRDPRRQNGQLEYQ